MNKSFKARTVFDDSLKAECALLNIYCQTIQISFRLIKTFSLGKGGEAIFLSTATEIQRLAFTKRKA